MSDLAVLGAHRGYVDQVVQYAETVLGLADRLNSGFIGKKLDG